MQDHPDDQSSVVAGEQRHIAAAPSDLRPE